MTVWYTIGRVWSSRLFTHCLVMSVKHCVFAWTWRHSVRILILCTTQCYEKWFWSCLGWDSHFGGVAYHSLCPHVNNSLKHGVQKGWYTAIENSTNNVCFTKTSKRLTDRKNTSHFCLMSKPIEETDRNIFLIFAWCLRPCKYKYFL